MLLASFGMVEQIAGKEEAVLTHGELYPWVFQRSSWSSLTTKGCGWVYPGILSPSRDREWETIIQFVDL